jgi:hypothetical protein
VNDAIATTGISELIADLVAKKAELHSEDGGKASMRDKDTRKEPPPVPERSPEEEARELIQEHIEDRRAIAEKLRRRTN